MVGLGRVAVLGEGVGGEGGNAARGSILSGGLGGESAWRDRWWAGGVDYLDGGTAGRGEPLGWGFWPRGGLMWVGGAWVCLGVCLVLDVCRFV